MFVTKIYGIYFAFNVAYFLHNFVKQVRISGQHLIRLLSSRCYEMLVEIGFEQKAGHRHKKICLVKELGAEPHAEFVAVEYLQDGSVRNNIVDCMEIGWVLEQVLNV